MAYDAVIGSVLMGVGLLGIGRAVIVVMRDETGRFPIDPAISTIIGSVLILLWQSLV